jgi:hypothetical protein
MYWRGPCLFAPARGGGARVARAARPAVKPKPAFRLHAWAFVLGNALLIAANALIGGDWWAFWPLLLWALALLAHYLVMRARTVDEHWVEERTEDVRAKSYDRAHIDSIERRYCGPEKK